MQEIQFILYVEDQIKSRDFYSSLLQLSPSLDVPGMTEFLLSTGVKLGLMPEQGIAKILSSKTPHPSDGSGIPRCELYLKVNDATKYIVRAINLDAKLISPLKDRDWGDRAAYFADIDGHIIAFAEKRIK